MFDNNNFMQQYNAELQRLQSEYSQGMAQLQNNLNNFRQMQSMPNQMQGAPVPTQPATTEPPFNMQILAVLGDIKGMLDKLIPKEVEPPKDPENGKAKK